MRPRIDWESRRSGVALVCAVECEGSQYYTEERFAAVPSSRVVRRKYEDLAMADIGQQIALDLFRPALRSRLEEEDDDQVGWEEITDE